MSLRALQFIKLVTPELATKIFYNQRGNFKNAHIMELYQVLDIIVELNIEDLNMEPLEKSESHSHSKTDQNYVKIALSLMESLSKFLFHTNTASL